MVVAIITTVHGSRETTVDTCTFLSVQSCMHLTETLISPMHHCVCNKKMGRTVKGYRQRGQVLGSRTGRLHLHLLRTQGNLGIEANPSDTVAS